MKTIKEISSEMNLDYSSLELYGNDKAKIPLTLFDQKTQNDQNSLIVITAITPTPAGEGKSTTAVGLTQGLAKIGEKPILTIRQPSLGPVFGNKGGGTGGGKSTVQPAVDINLHFTGDFHAIQSAHNLLAATVDNSVYRNKLNGLDVDGISFGRVIDSQDRSLRNISINIGGKSGRGTKNSGFDISSASEIMAICALSTSYEDLRYRLENIIIGWTKDNTPVFAKEVGCVGSMMALLRDTLKPNLVQTVEGQPAIVHMGPFGNIAHGCSSIIADRLASVSGNFVITEAGFGADLGFQKYMDIKVRQGGIFPRCAVIVVTTKGLKWHGGVNIESLTEKNSSAIVSGSKNLENAIRIVKLYGLPSVVAINKFHSDSDSEIELIKKLSKDYGADGCEISDSFNLGGNGTVDLAETVAEISKKNKKHSKLLYNDNDSVFEKVEIMAKKLYKAKNVEWSTEAKKSIKTIEENKMNYPICMAKTHLSLSSNPKLRNAPTEHILPIKKIKILSGAQQIVTLAGNIITLPGLPESPNANTIDLTSDGEITGILST